MNAKTQPEIVSRETVKPSLANHSTTHRLSFFDQLSPRIYVSLVLFFSTNDKENSVHHRSQLLKKSLSEALSLFYPLAGRTRADNLIVDCNDEGILFLEAKMQSAQLSEVVNSKDTIQLLFPDGLQYKDSSLSTPLVVQTTYFGCGGMAIALCVSHPLLDMASICSFLNMWAAITRSPSANQKLISPDFNLGSLHPQVDLPITKPIVIEQVKCVSKRFVFDGSKIAELKAKAGKEVENPTRVEVVTALIYKCAISAARKSSGSIKPASIHLAINLRTRVSPPLSESSMGNLTGTFPVRVEKERDIEWVHLAGEIRKEKTKYCEGCIENSSNVEALETFVLESSKGVRELCCGEEEDVYMCSSWCWFPFYEADFGWGKPIWVTPAVCEMRNLITMMDSRGGNGIEAWVTLEEQEMALLERDEELLAFTIVDSSPIYMH